MAFRFCVLTMASRRRHAREVRHAVHPAQPLRPVERRRRRAAGSPGDTTPTTAAPHRPEPAARRGLQRRALPADRARLHGLRRDKTTGWSKRIAKPHQYFAVTKAVGSHHRCGPQRRQAGVVWHTQGSGKSMEMELYTYALIPPALAQPDDRRHHRPHRARRPAVLILRAQRAPARARRCRSRRRKQLREALSRTRSGGIYFTTLQKFGRTGASATPVEAHPLLSDRSNVIVIVDEAHRSHYDDLDGYAATCKRRPAQCHAHRLHGHADQHGQTTTLARSSATTSTSMTSPEPSRTAPPFRSTSSPAHQGVALDDGVTGRHRRRRDEARCRFGRRRARADREDRRQHQPPVWRARPDRSAGSTSSPTGSPRRGDGGFIEQSGQSDDRRARPAQICADSTRPSFVVGQAGRTRPTTRAGSRSSTPASRQDPGHPTARPSRLGQEKAVKERLQRRG
jgi:hypothetical protein